MTIYVLVHGSWHCGAAWARVAARLQAAGHDVFTPDLAGHGERASEMTPSVGLMTHVGDIVRLVRDEDLVDVILVGHSYGGAVISCVANEVPDRIAHLVYIDAVVPEDGESTADVMPEVFRPFIDRAVAEGAWLLPPPPASPAGMFGITDPADIEWVASTLTDQSLLSWTEKAKLDNPAADVISRSHIHCALHPRGDLRRPVPPLQPNGKPARVWELQSGHDCMIIAPEALTELLLITSTDSESLEHPI